MLGFRTLKYVATIVPRLKIFVIAITQAVELLFDLLFVTLILAICSATALCAVEKNSNDFISKLWNILDHTVEENDLTLDPGPSYSITVIFKSW